MKPIRTKFTKLMNITTPIIAAPMAFASTADLASSVSGAGGFGFIGAGFDSIEQLKSVLRSARTSLDVPVGRSVPIGVGFLGWILDATEVSESPRLAAVLDEKPAAVWFAFGVDLGKYVKQVRKHDEDREHKTTVFSIVNSVAEARKAANEWRVDVLVVQGVEAGGHGTSHAPPLHNLLQGVLQAALPDSIPILAAGGISSGAQIASLLTLGADGVVCGTRFLFTPECCYDQPKKDVLLSADLHSTVRSLAFDEVGRTAFWPPGLDGRAISNGIIRDAEAGLSLERRLALCDESLRKGESDRLIVWAGVGAGLVDEIKPASDVLVRLHEDALRALKAAVSLVDKVIN